MNQINNNNQGVVQERKPTQLNIVGAESGTCFFVTGVNGNEEIKTKLKGLGGYFNSHTKGYKFKSKDLEKVCQSLGLEPNIVLTDPRKVINLEFIQKFKWPGDMSVAEQKLKEAGLTKKGGKGNTWQGDLSNIQAFFAAFNVGGQ